MIVPPSEGFNATWKNKKHEVYFLTCQREYILLTLLHERLNRPPQPPRHFFWYGELNPGALRTEAHAQPFLFLRQGLANC